MSLKLEQELLSELDKAEKRGAPLTHNQCGAWVVGSTFEDLWSSGCINVKGQESRISVFHVTGDSEYVLTSRGKKELAQLQAK